MYEMNLYYEACGGGMTISVFILKKFILGRLRMCMYNCSNAAHEGWKRTEERSSARRVTEIRK